MLTTIIHKWNRLLREFAGFDHPTITAEIERAHYLMWETFKSLPSGDIEDGTFQLFINGNERMLVHHFTGHVVWRSDIENL